MTRYRSVFVATGIAAWASYALVAPARAQGNSPARAEADQRQSRYQIAQMERVLEGAVEHGATMIHDRLQAVAPAQLLILDNARARGFRLEGYGVFFDVIVPSLDASLVGILRTLDQNDLGLERALNVLKTRIDPTDIDLQQALKRVELQVAPAALTSVTAPAAPGARNATGSAASVAEQTAAPPPPEDPILDNPNAAYRGEIITALIDAMLDHSAALGVAPEEWLTIAARRNEERPRLAPADSDAQTFVLRARGADLIAFRAGQVSRDEVVKRIDRRVF